MDTILHALGLCGDHHSHLDLMDILMGGTAGCGIYATFRYYGTGIKLYIKSLFNKERKIE
jgi:hypothetical protein